MLEEIKQKSFVLTSVFETSMKPPYCFGVVAGNFDGQGMSFGPLQWNLGQGTLQPMIRELIKNHPDMVKSIFKEKYSTLEKYFQPIATKEQIAWANSISLSPEKRQVISPWKEYFNKLGQTKECQQAMIKAATHYFNKAYQDFLEMGFYSERAYALLYDIYVQNGSISQKVKDNVKKDLLSLPKGTTPEQLEIAKMKSLAIRRAEVANPKFKEDVLERKMCIATGKGKVHGSMIECEKFNITLKKIL